MSKWETKLVCVSELDMDIRFCEERIKYVNDNLKTAKWTTDPIVYRERYITRLKELKDKDVT